MFSTARKILVLLGSDAGLGNPALEACLGDRGIPPAQRDPLLHPRSAASLGKASHDARVALARVARPSLTRSPRPEKHRQPNAAGFSPPQVTSCTGGSAGAETSTEQTASGSAPNVRRKK